jgi:hypothetical protein
VNSKKLHNLCSSPNIISIIRPMKMRRLKHGAQMRQMREAHKILLKNLKGKPALEF